MIPGLPGLSDDFYRFIWDGMLWHEGIHPFAYTPSELIASGYLSDNPIWATLFHSMNSPEYHTVYPPVAQGLFYLATLGQPENIYQPVLIMKVFMVIAAAASLLLLTRLLSKYKKPLTLVAWYALNPLAILELSGNLHLEGLALPFLLWAIYNIGSKKFISGFSGISFAILVKLNPAIALPILWKSIGWKRGLVYVIGVTVVSGGTLILIITPDVLSGMASSLDLYFRHFEFNASLYYLLREAGYLFKGYNIIAGAGPALALVGGLSILAYSLISKASLPRAVIFIYMIFWATATTVHPWYIIPMVALAPVAGLRFPLVWSLLIFFTYAGYTVEGYEEILILTFLEYGTLTAVIWYDLKNP